jgi:hypothetical protein
MCFVFYTRVRFNTNLCCASRIRANFICCHARNYNISECVKVKSTRTGQYYD